MITVDLHSKLCVETVGSGIRVRMNGTEYSITDTFVVTEFKADMGWFSSLSALVEKYLSKLQRVAKRVISAIVRMALELADADNYRRGVGAATLADARRYL